MSPAGRAELRSHDDKSLGSPNSCKDTVFSSSQ